MVPLIALFALAVCLGALAFPIWVIARVMRIGHLESEIRRMDSRINGLAEAIVTFRAEPHAAIVPVTAPVTIDRRETAAPAAPPSAERHGGTLVTRSTGPARETNASPEPNAPTPSALMQRAPQADAATVVSPTRDIEAKLGTSWLNKIGALLLVVGIASFLTYQLRTLGPLGKDLVGLALGVALLAGGSVAERRTAYRVFSRGVMAAGWALLFFTTFAMHHVPAARVIQSEPLDLALMSLVAAGMVAHALRYASETVTCLAFSFAFGTVALSHHAAFTLSAGAILAIAAATSAIRMRWSILEVGAIAGTYLNHFLWLPALASASPAAAPHQLLLSLAMLAFYWVTFRVGYVLRRTGSADTESWSALSAALNTGGVIAVANHHPLGWDIAFWALLLLAAADILFAQLVRERRVAFCTLTTMAVALTAAAFPIRFGARTVSMAWLIESEALVIIGVRTRDSLFTRLGVLGAALSGVYMFTSDVSPLVNARAVAAAVPDPQVALLLVLAAAVYYANSRWFLPHHNAVFPLDFERTLADRSSYAGAAALFGAAWAACPGTWLAVIWIGLALVLVIAGTQVHSFDLWLQAQIVALLAALRVATVNLPHPVLTAWIDVRLVTVGLAVLAYQAMSRLSANAPRRDGDQSSGFSMLHSWISAALLAALLWYEFEPLAVAVAWTAAGVLALEAGLRYERQDLVRQALAGLTIGFARVFFVNLNAGGGLLGSGTLATAPIAILLFYAYDRLDGRSSAREWPWVPGLLAAMGTVTIAAVLRLALTPALVAVGWSTLVLLLAITSLVTSRPLFMRHATVGATAVAVQAVGVNIYGASYFPQWWSSARFCVGVSSLLLLLVLPLARRHRSAASNGLVAAIQRPEMVMFFVPFVLVTWLLATTMTGGLVTMAWGLEAVGAFLLAFSLRERAYRLAALTLLLSCVGRIVAIDVWRLDQQGRYVAFIALGSALLIVSFLYSKFREQIEEYF